MKQVIIIEEECNDGYVDSDILYELFCSVPTYGFEIGIFANVLSDRMGYIIKKEQLIEWLKKKKILMSSKSCEPYQEYIDKIWFTKRKISIKIGDVEIFQTGLLVLE